MKKNSGSALTSVIVVFMLVTLIGAPLLTMVVYNYQFREYDSAIKEAEYKNEVAMDIIATIIKREVITAITSAKTTTTEDVKTLTDGLINSYNGIYNDVYDEVLKSEEAKYDDKTGPLLNKDEVEDLVRDKISTQIGSNSNLLDMSNLTGVKINEENLQKYCNNIFQKQYQKNLLDPNNGIFKAIYNDNEYVSMADNIIYGKSKFSVDPNTNKASATTLKVVSKYNYNFVSNDFEDVYIKDGNNTNFSFDLDGNFNLGIETQYKRKPSAPITELSATYVISTPDFNFISSLEQQSIALSNPVLDYGLVVGETLNINQNGKLNIDGNMIARANGIREEIDAENKIKKVDKGIVLEQNSELKSTKIGTDNPSNGRIVTSGDVIMNKDTRLSTGLNPIYYRNLYIGAPKSKKNDGNATVNFNGDVLAKDDLEINLEGNVDISQNLDSNLNASYYGFNDKNDDGPDSSSAIVINSNNVDNIKIKLNNLYLAGRAFIEGVKSVNRKNEISEGISKPLYYKTGESISVKGNYIAYQTPLVNTNDYNDDGVTGDYDLDKVKFSPYFMEGQKSGIDGNTNLVLNLADNFINQIGYEEFDKQHKWKYFKSYATQKEIKSPNISLESVKYIEGVGLNKTGLIDRINDPKQQSINLSKENRFNEFTKYLGYLPKDDKNKKEYLDKWLKFGNKDKIEKNGNLFVYISSNTATNKTIEFSDAKNDKLDGNSKIVKVIPDEKGNNNINGIIIHKGDLIIESVENINFNGVIIVTGNLTIKGLFNVITDKEKTSKIIIDNYLGKGVDGTGNSDNIGAGGLFDSFEYDGSGTTYVIITVADQSNMIDINSLIGIKDWKKRRFVGI